MKNLKSIKISAIIVTLLILVVSCKDDFCKEDRAIDTSLIAFSVNEFNKGQTRTEDREEQVREYCGTIEMEDEETGQKLYLHKYVEDGINLNDGIENLTRSDDSNLIKSIDEIDKFNVYGARYKDEWDMNQRMNLMDNEVFSKNENGYWRPSKDYQWYVRPSRTRFFAYYPIPDNINYYNINNKDGIPTITYTSSDANGVDLIVADSGEIEGIPSEIPSLDFKHILAAVKIEFSSEILPGTLKKLSLTKVSFVGSYKLDGNDQWEINTERGTTSFSFYNDDTYIDPDNEECLKFKNIKTFVLLPQTLPSNSKLEVNYIPDYSGVVSNIMTADLSGEILEAGKTVTYVISTSKISVDYFITIGNLTNLTNTYNQNGTLSEKSFSISSSIKINLSNSSNNRAYENVEYEFVTKNDANEFVPMEKPSWISLTEQTISSNSGSYTRNFKFSIGRMNGRPCGEVTQKLKNTEQFAYEYSRQDVSKKRFSDISNTSNCYVINAPGFYKFPVVYGNGITNNIDIIQTKYSGKFVNYKGESIMQAEMEEPYDAIVVWEDAPDLIKDVYTYYEDKPYVYFEISKENIAQGNAVIAVRDAEGVMMWSWHIWVTDKDIENDYVMSGRDRSVKTLKYYIGWCEPETYSYDYEREAILHIYQKDRKNEKIVNERYVTITQKGEGEVVNPSYTWPLYQWGRKDPMRPIQYDVASSSWNTKPIYSEYYNNVGDNVLQTTDIPNSIKNPQLYYTEGKIGGYYNTWLTVINSELWGYTGSENTGYKTIYDPSPAGYRVPSNNESSLPKVYENYSYVQNFTAKEYFLIEGRSEASVETTWLSSDDSQEYVLLHPFSPVWYDSFISGLDSRSTVVGVFNNYYDTSKNRCGEMRFGSNSKYVRTSDLESAAPAKPHPIRPVAE